MTYINSPVSARAVDLDFDPHLLLEDCDGRQIACYWPERGYLTDG